MEILLNPYRVILWDKKGWSDTNQYTKPIVDPNASVYMKQHSQMCFKQLNSYERCKIIAYESENDPVKTTEWDMPYIQTNHNWQYVNITKTRI